MDEVPGRRWIVSSLQGYWPLWTLDGSRILYMTAQSTAYTVEVRTAPSFSAGEPASTFEFAHLGIGNAMDVSADGRQLLVAVADGSDSRDPRPGVHVVLNWAERVAARFANEGAGR